YRDIFEHILNEPLSVGQEAVQQAVQAVNEAKQAGLPILFLLHRGRDTQESLNHWKALVKHAEGQQDNALATLAAEYVVIVLPIDDLAELSHHLSIRPFAAPDQNLPLFVIARSDARQLTAVTSWSKPTELVDAMALGLVQEAKEHPRTKDQLIHLQQSIKTIDLNLAQEVAELIQEQGSE
ncbi:MAG TPA: hypothetical protein VFT74_12040, partial [Isosphaeraceae bacterium]|nr:hypothetical protein [Isosphaeraceae bacterium]